MKHLRRCLALMLSFVMIATMVPLSSVEVARAAEVGSLLAEYRFEDSDVTDKAIADTTGNGYDAALVGEGAAVSDGVLTLPGGAAGSNAAYVSIPGRLFENRDTLTISIWLKNATGKGDYSAMYFGKTTKHLGGGSSDMPLHYWILNPMNPSEYFKSVWTNGDNASTPYSTETPVSSTKTSADWGLYTTVITPDKIIGYYNGVEVCNNTKSKTTTDFGTGLVGCIGRSAYNDKFYKGGVYGVRVYDQALSQAEVWEEYYSDMPPALNKETVAATAIAEVKSALVLDSTVTRDLSLPTEGAKGTRITWESIKPEVISTDGKVNVPTDTDADVTLTATIAVGGKSDTKEFVLKVPAVSMQEQFNNRVKEFSLGTFFVSSDFELPNALGANTNIAWSSSNTNAMEIVTTSGKITAKVKRSATDNADVRLTLKAVITYKNGSDNFSAEKSFDIMVRGEEDYAYLMAYTNTKERADLGNSLHLAYSVDGKAYTALNSNTGICFANNQGGNKNSNPNGLQSIYIFRKADGTYGMVARNTSTQKYIYVFDSVDLIHFTNERKLELGHDVSGDLQVNAVSEQGAVSYEIFWKSGSKTYRAVTTDFATAANVQEANYVKETLGDGCTPPEGASVGNVMRISKSEYQRVVGKLDIVRNTGIRAPRIEVKPGQTLSAASLLPQTVKADYNDGSVTDMKVVWNQQDIAQMDLSKAGTYQVKGTVQQTQYANPFIQQRADPCILKGNDGYYYFTASYPMCGGSDRDGYDKVVLRRAETINGLADAEEITIWDCDDSNDEYRYIWAPEIRLVDEQYYVFYTSSVNSGSPWGIRPHVLKCTNSEDIMNPASWQAMGIMQANSTDKKAFTDFSLDMTVFEHQGRWYVIWPQTDQYSSLFIAEIDKDEPWRCISDSVKISIPEFSWERQVENVNEGPSVIKNNGKIFVAFSAAGTGPEYCVGLLSIDEDDDLLDAQAWEKQGYPVLTSSDVPGEYGPGHNSFTVDEDGNAIFVYHARGQQCYDKQCAWAKDGSLYDPCRDARLKRVHWASDGTPILKMSYAEELAEENKTVTATIKVRVPVSRLTLNKTSLSLTVGGSETLKATISPANASDKAVTWKSDNTKVATVMGGKVTARAAGTATITAAAADGKTAKCKVTVKSVTRVSKVTLNKKSLTLGSGEKFTLKATVTPSKATNKKVKWSSNSKKASVSQKGVVTAKKVNKATKVTITAKADGKSAKCTVTVKPAPKKITLNAKKKTLKKGKSFQIKVKLPKNTASNTIKYKSSNKKVASVSAKGKVKAVKKGKATITVTTFNKKNAKITFTVK